MASLKWGSKGPEVKALQQKLLAKGFNPGAIDGDFGPGTDAAVRAFQRSERLLADGVAGPRTLAALGLAGGAAVVPPFAVSLVTVDRAAEIFPDAPIGNLRKFLPPVLAELQAAGLGDRPMVLMALATIRAETSGFEPISEYKSRFNTSPSGHPFDLYDNRADLGNTGKPDGELFKGRGFVQLTGRNNYARIGSLIGLGDKLVKEPELANDPTIAAKILASFLKATELRIKEALLEDDLRQARRLVNGGSHGLERFTEAYRTGQRVIPEHG